MKTNLLYILILVFPFLANGQETSTTSGYTFDGHFREGTKTIAFNGNPIYHHKVFIDETKKLTISDIQTQKDDLEWQNPAEMQGELDKVYWLKATFYGNAYFKGTQLLHISSELGSDGYSFDYIDAYISRKNDPFQHQRTGKKVALRDRPINFWANFIKLELQPSDTLDLIVRMEGADGEFLMQGIGLYHIDKTSLFPRQVNFAWKNGVFYGILTIQFLFFLILFIIEKERIHLYFCLSVLGYLLSMGFIRDNYNQYLPFPFFYQTRAIWSNLGIFLVVFGGLKFIETYFSFPKKSIYSKWLIPGLLLSIGLVTFLDTFIYTQWIDSLKGILVLLFLLCLVLMIVKGWKMHPKLGRFYLLAFFPSILIALLYWNIRLWDYNGFQNEGWLLNLFSDLFKAGGIWLVTFLALSIGNRTNQLKEEKNKALQKNLDTQRHIHQAITRFVPKEFLQALGKTDITQVQLGDNTEKEVTIFFSDIRDYTALSEQMSPKENFQFVNAYNVRMGPIIQQNNGFVHQYRGDGIMALFPKSPSDGLRAALQMQQALQLYNERRTKKGRRAIEVGMGLHTGPLIMGITGDKKRLDTTTISSSVDTASYIESLTKQFGIPILVSENCISQLPNKSIFNLQYVGEVQQQLKIYSCLESDI